MGELWIPLLSSKSFFIVLIAQKKIQCPQLKQPRKHLHTRSRLLVPHSQPASPKWCPTPEITWHHDQSPWEWSIKPSRVISTKNNTTSMCSPSWNAMKTHLCSSRSSCCCWSNDCFESYTERESYCGRLLISGTLETAVRLCQWWAGDIQTVVSLIKFINNKYCAAFRRFSLLRTLLAVQLKQLSL